MLVTGFFDSPAGGIAMVAGAVAVVGALSAATLLSLGPPACWKWLQDRSEAAPNDGIGSGSTVVLLLLNLAVAGLVLAFVPGAPAVQWGTLSTVDWALVLATSPGIFVLGALLAAGYAQIGIDASPDVEDIDALLPVLPAMVLVGPAEELLFRGLVQPLLTDAVGTVAGVLLMGVLFGLYHYPNVGDSLLDIDLEGAAELSLSGAGGVFLGVLYLYTGNLLVPILGHSLHDTILFAYLAWTE